jgi:diaminopimelate epimerase
MELRFSKVEGLGNDFLLVDRSDAPAEALGREVERLRRLAPALCDRRTGVGADGILIVGAPLDPQADARMIVINHDGSRPEMCGNGIRCVAQRVAFRCGESRVSIETDGGPRRCEVGGGDARLVRVDMGPARRLGPVTPAAAAPRVFHGVSMGNPHAVHIVDDEDPEALARTLGPRVEVDPAYPDRTNVELARIEGDRLVLWVWERGCGITLACGTGACAAAAVAVDLHLAAPDRDLAVCLPGGTLTVRVPADPHAGVAMTGPARVVFEGSIDV